LDEDDKDKFEILEVLQKILLTTAALAALLSFCLFKQKFIGSALVYVNMGLFLVIRLSFVCFERLS
jgi:hypothetical protein